YEGRRRPRSSAHDAGSWVTSSWSGAKDDGASAHARDFTTALPCRTRTFVPVTQSDPGRCSDADAGQERSETACRAAASICPTGAVTTRAGGAGHGSYSTSRKTPGRGRSERSVQRAATCSAPSVARALTNASAESNCQELSQSTTWTGTSAAAASSRSGASLC